MIDFHVILSYVLPRLVTNIVLSGFLGAILGSLIGVAIGAIRRRIEDTVVVAIMGSVFGCLLMLSLPSISQPGALRSWGMGGGLGSIVVIFTLFFVALGGFVGGLIASTFGFKLVWNLDSRWVTGILIVTLMLMALSLYLTYFGYCPSSVSPSYC